MASAEARAFWERMRAAPKQIDLPLAARREAGEHAEDATAEPADVTFEPAPAVGGLWARPPDAGDGTAILYLFGGGYVLGSPASRRRTAGHIALAARAPVLVADYRLAPEHRYPCALDDALAAFAWLKGQGYAADRIAIAGDSAGGGLAVATAIAIRDAGLARAGALVALSPWADLTCSGASMSGNAASDVECTREGLLAMAGDYLAGVDPRTPTASPVFADLTNLPPLLCSVGGEEVLLDDSVRLVRSAGLAGTSAELRVVGGMQHVFPIWSGVFPEAAGEIAIIGRWIRDHLAPTL
ncbi:MAG: alpha/beta hydrolase [Microvirga sp.]